jgi:hypothetical protein
MNIQRYIQVCVKSLRISRFWLSCFSPRNENLQLLVGIRFLSLFLYTSSSKLKLKNLLVWSKLYWSWVGGPVLIVRTIFNALWFYYSQTRFKLFDFPIFRFWAYQMKVILSVSDEGYSERIRWRLFRAYQMKVILSVSDEGYSERIRWRLFWAYHMKVILSVSDEGYSERIRWRLFWAYQMKVISETCYGHLIRYLRLYYRVSKINLLDI